MPSVIVGFELAGRDVEVMVSPLATLQSVLRTQLGQTSVKEGCRQGGCGSCTVLVDGEPMLSCLLPAQDVEGRRITTVEGLTPPGGLHPVQQAFLDGNGYQCGYCTPGMEVVATALLEHNPSPSRDEIVDALAGNVCRCTGYEPVIDAIGAAAAAIGSGGRPMTAEAQELHVVGESVARNDGVGFVTGRAQYSADLTFPGMLHLRMVRSPLHHARIRGVDLSEARQVPGFVRALTHEDVPHNVYTILGLIGVEPEEEFVLPVDRVRYRGEPIVAILAETEAAAYEAAARVRLDLEELPAVFDMDEALAPGAPVVTHWGSNTFIYEGDTKRKVRLGDVEAGFAMADHILEGEYRTSPIEHAPTETTGCIAVPEPNGRFTVYTNTQALYFSLDNTAIILQVPNNRLRFIGGMVGGGFGGKVDVIVEPLATLGGDAHRPPGPVRLQPDRGDAGQLHPQPRDHPDQGRRDGRRDDRRAQGHRPDGLRRVQPPDARTRSPSTPPTRPARTGSPTCGSTRTASTPTGRRPRRCAGSGSRCRRSRPRCRWTRSPSWWASTRGPSGSGTRSGTGTSSRIARPRWTSR